MQLLVSTELAEVLGAGWLSPKKGCCAKVNAAFLRLGSAFLDISVKFLSPYSKFIGEIYWRF